MLLRKPGHPLAVVPVAVATAVAVVRARDKARTSGSDAVGWQASSADAAVPAGWRPAVPARTSRRDGLEPGLGRVGPYLTVPVRAGLGNIRPRPVCLGQVRPDRIGPDLPSPMPC